MTALTERYLAAALRGIPDRQKPDVERELRSSIADALEDRVAGGEDQAQAEKAVLEGLGDPARLAAGMTGGKLFLIGPDLFVEYRQLLTTLMVVIVPIVGVLQAVIALAGGEDLLGATLIGAGLAWTVALHLFFWVTIVFALVDRLDQARDARDEISGAAGRWTVDRLPPLTANRIGVGETVGEVLTSLITAGALLLISTATLFADADGTPITLLNPEVWSITMPVLVGVLVLVAGLQLVVFLVGRWTMPLFIAYAVLELAFAIPVVALTLTGNLINQAFAEAVGWPELAEGTGWVAIVIAASVVLVTAWEIIDAFRRTRRAVLATG